MSANKLPAADAAAFCAKHPENRRRPGKRQGGDDEGERTSARECRPRSTITSMFSLGLTRVGPIVTGIA